MVILGGGSLQSGDIFFGGEAKKKDYNIVGSVMGSPNFVEMATLLLTFSGRSRMRRVYFGLKVFDRVHQSTSGIEKDVQYIDRMRRVWGFEARHGPVPFLDLYELQSKLLKGGLYRGLYRGVL